MRNDEQARLTELVLYVGAKCALDEHYGVLKLNKILFYSDFRAYRSLGQAITGVEYRKYEHGPAPACMKALRERLVHSGDAIEWINPLPYFNDDGEQHAERRLLPKREADMDKFFSAKEMSVIDSVIEWLRPMTGQAVSKLSHRHPGWDRAQMHMTIPYSAALLGEEIPTTLSERDGARAKDVAEKYRRGEFHFQ